MTQKRVRNMLSDILENRTPRVSQEYRFTERDKVKYPEELSFRILEISRQSFAGKILINGLYYQTQKSTIAKLLKVAKLE